MPLQSDDENDNHKKKRKQTAKLAPTVDFRDTTNFALKNTLYLTLPLITVICWFAGVFVIEVSLTNTVWSLGCNMFFTQQAALSSVTLIDAAIEPTLVRHGWAAVRVVVCTSIDCDQRACC